MKKLLLLAIAAATTMAAWAADAKWTSSVSNIFKDNKPVYSGAVTIDASGNSYVAGAYNQDATINGSEFTAIGNSAYVAKYDATGAAQWTINFEGAANVTSMTTDASGNLYIAGTFADEVTLGSTDKNSVVIEGAKMDGTFTTSLCASFIAKYTSVGVLTAHTEFVPKKLSDAPEAYEPEDGEIYFNINHICTDGSKVYASAQYTNETVKDNITFKGQVLDPFGIGYFMGINGASTFSLNTDLTGCEKIATCAGGVDFDEFLPYQPYAPLIGIANGKIYSVFTACGQASFTYGDKTQSLTNKVDELSFTFITTDGKFGSFKIENGDGGLAKNDIPFALAADGTNVECIGEQWTKKDDVTTHEVFVYTLSGGNPENATVKSYVAQEGDNQFSTISGATFANNNWIFAAGGRDAKGNASGTYRCYILENGVLAAAPAAEAFTLGSNGNVVTYATIAATGTTYAQYEAPTSGISDIISGDENAPVEYFNLQGIRVAEPTPGMYIMRQGSKTSKVVIR